VGVQESVGVPERAGVAARRCHDRLPEKDCTGIPHHGVLSMRTATHPPARRLLAIALAFAAPLAVAEPAPWRTENGTRHPSLPGTMHALPKDLPWLSASTRQTLAESRRLMAGLAPDCTPARKISAFMRGRESCAAGSLSAPPGADAAPMVIATERKRPVLAIEDTVAQLKRIAMADEARLVGEDCGPALLRAAGVDMERP
jgi:uncharacterized protein YbaP (TraB family)